MKLEDVYGPDIETMSLETILDDWSEVLALYKSGKVSVASEQELLNVNATTQRIACLCFYAKQMEKLLSA